MLNEMLGVLDSSNNLEKACIFNIKLSNVNTFRLFSRKPLSMAKHIFAKSLRPVKDDNYFVPKLDSKKSFIHSDYYLVVFCRY